MEHNDRKGFKVLSIGWEPQFIDYLLSPIAKHAEVDFTHGLVGDASRINVAIKKYPHLKFVALSKTINDALPAPDYELLGSLECVGVLTIKSMIQGDRVLRHLPAHEVLAYATLLARRMRESFLELQPDVVLGSFDSLHAALSLAVAKSMGIPWVAMTFTVIPDNLTGFCRGLTPNTLLPLKRTVDEQLRSQAKAILGNVRSKGQRVLAYRPPTSLSQWVLHYLQHGKNLLRRLQKDTLLGIDQFTYPSKEQRLHDLGRRMINRLRLPSSKMLTLPPEESFVYYPFHMAPESMLDTWAPFYQNQVAFLTQLSLAIPAGTAFVVKLHFSDPDNYSRHQLQQLMRLPRLHIAHPDAPGSAFLEKAALVVGIQGTSCLEAALLGKPVLIFGDSPYQHFPRSERAKRPDQLYGQIRRMLNLPPPTDEEIVEAYAAYMARYMPGRINDWARPIEPDLLDQYADCFRALRAYLDAPHSRINWYNQPPFVAADKDSTSCRL